MLYESVNNSKIKELKKLNTKKYRDESGLFLIEGEHLIKEAYQSDNLISLIVLDGNDIDINIDKIIVNEKVMKYISNLECPPKVIGICHKLTKSDIGSKVLVLDNIQDPGNLGTIIRSAVAFNFDTILLSKDTVDLYNPKVIRASQGMIFHLNINTCDVESKLKELKENNYHIIGTDVVQGKSIKEVAKSKKIL